MSKNETKQMYQALSTTVKKQHKKSKIITLSSVECPTFRTLMTALQFGPLICSIIKLNLADVYFQCSSSVSGPESSASFLICLLSIRTWNQYEKQHTKCIL